jgi:hypothetical protein
MTNYIHVKSIRNDYSEFIYSKSNDRGHRGRDRVVSGFTTTYGISAYHHWSCEFESQSGRGVYNIMW